MCGRYLTPDEAALERAWQLPVPSGYHQSFNLAPSQLAPVVVARDGNDWLMDLFVWGFRPDWAKRAWINARMETVFTSRAFSRAARRRRCLVPAAGWYEWQGDKPPRQPWLFHLDGFKPFAFAGIYVPPGKDEQSSFAILTTDAPPPLAGIHNRMPVVLAAGDYGRWLSADCGVDEAQGILANTVSAFEVYKVSPYVNKPDHNDAACITPSDQESERQ